MKRVLMALFALTAFIAPLSVFAQTAPEVFTYTPESVTERTALLKGAVTPHYAGTRAWVEHGATSALGRVSNLPQPAEPEVKYDVQLTLSGLAPGSVYYYRVVAESVYGRRQGEIISFRTAVTAPVAQPENPPVTPPTTPPTNPGTVPPGENSQTAEEVVAPISTSPAGCLSLVSGTSESEFMEGDVVTYQVTYRNGCTISYVGATLVLTFPEGMEFVETNYPDYVRDGNVITYNLRNMAPRFQSSISLTARVNKNGGDFVFLSSLRAGDTNGRSAGSTDTLRVVAGGKSKTGETVKHFLSQIGGILPDMTKNIWFWIFLIPLIILAFGYRSLAKKKKNGISGASEFKISDEAEDNAGGKGKAVTFSEDKSEKFVSPGWNKEKLMGILENTPRRIPRPSTEEQ